MKGIVIKLILWTVLIMLLYFNVGFWSLVLDIRENNKIDREIKREEKKKAEKQF